VEKKKKKTEIVIK